MWPIIVLFQLSYAHQSPGALVEISFVSVVWVKPESMYVAQAPGKRWSNWSIDDL